MTPTEAYCCYKLYIQPRLTYPMLCTTLTQKQCRMIQAPVLEAILPKLQLNMRTPRAVLFAGPRYGGLALPEKYTDQTYRQLQMLVGHLKLQDDNGLLTRCLLTYTQLQIGPGTPFFKLKYPNIRNR
jgi:hypothetical protein